MKKKYLTYTGIISALALAGIFIGILLTGIPFPFIPPATTMDPIVNTNIDDYNVMVLTGSTTLAEDIDLSVRVTASPRSLMFENTTETRKARGFARIISETNGTSRWKGIVDISSLQPDDYIITLSTVTYSENYTRIESDPIATQHILLGDENADPGSIRKKTRVVKPFIRINPPDQNPGAAKLEISGITSLAPGTPLAWSMHTVTNGTGNSTQEFSGTTSVTDGAAGINRWYVVPGSGAMKPARYQFRITENRIGSTLPAGTISASSEFDILPIPATQQNTTDPEHISPGFITIDSLPDMTTEGTYIITGTTSLPPDEELLVRVTPALSIDFSVDSNGSQIARGTSDGGTIKVVNGSGGKNLWSYELQTYIMIPGRYEVNASTVKYDNGADFPDPGDLYSSRIVTIGG